MSYQPINEVRNVIFDKEFEYVARWIIALTDETEEGNVMFEDLKGNKLSYLELDCGPFCSNVWLPLYCKKIYLDGTTFNNLKYAK